MENMASRSLQILYMFVLRKEKVTIFDLISSRNTNIYKICKLREAIFSKFYNISPPNLAILLILVMLFSTIVKDFVRLA